MQADFETWVRSTVPLQEQLTPIVTALIQRLLKEKGIDHLSVEGRTKSIDSCLEKIQRKTYTDPQSQLTDICGVRVITFFESQAESVGEALRSFFAIDSANSSDMRDRLGDDKIGYRSSHFVCQLGTGRAKLPEYSTLTNLNFEVQVRTVLQHAWAELAHDRAYKFSGALPPSIRRQLNLYSGTLEIIDRGFDEISRQIDAYKEQVSKSSQSQLEDSPLDSITIDRFLSSMKEVSRIPEDDSSITELVVKELQQFGVKTIKDLADLATDTFVEAHEKYIPYTTQRGFLRELMMYSDLSSYLTKAWNKNWEACSSETFALLSSKYGTANVNKLFNEHGVRLLGARRVPRKRS